MIFNCWDYTNIPIFESKLVKDMAAMIKTEVEREIFNEQVNSMVFFDENNEQKNTKIEKLRKIIKGGQSV